MKAYKYTVVDSDREEHLLIARYTTIEDGYVCFYNSEADRLHAFFQPISTVRTGEYNE